MVDLQKSQDELRRILGHLPQEEAADLPRLLTDIVTSIADKAVRETVPAAVDKIYEQTGYSREVAGLVLLLASKSNDSRDGVLRKALNLYAAALDAVEKGNRLAVLSPDDEILHDIVGFDHVEEGVEAMAE